MAENFLNNGVAVKFDSYRNSKRSGSFSGKQRLSKEEREERYERAKERVCRNVKYDGAKFVNFVNAGSSGLLVAGVEIGRKLHYAFLDKDRVLHLIGLSESKYEIAREIPATMSVLDYLVRYNKNDLIDLVESQIEDDWTVIEMGIHKQKPKNSRNDKKKSRKKN